MAFYLDEGYFDIEGFLFFVVEEFMFILFKIELEYVIDLDKELGVWEMEGCIVVGLIKDGKYFKFDLISFDYLSSISIGVVFGADYVYYGEVEIRKGQENGMFLGK